MFTCLLRLSANFSFCRVAVLPPRELEGARGQQKGKFARCLFAIFAVALFSNNISAQTNGPVVIPVVFHILHMGGSENISDAQVLNAVNQLNLNYNMSSSDTIGIIPAYQHNVANMGITFRLANIDPHGNCTNGIEHIYSSQTDVGGAILLPIHEWPRNEYLNVWVYKEIQLTSVNVEDFPWIADTLPTEDAVEMPNEYVGSIGTGSVLTSVVLTKEIAHFFGLIDTYMPGGLCLDLDSVADTPPIVQLYYANCDTSIMSCDTPLIENLQNFMYYAYCVSMFTNGQRARVYSYLNRSTAQRNNLWTDGNLSATGTFIATPSPCGPIADFSTPKRFVCLGPEVTFYDNSYNGDITSRLWTFPPSAVIVNSDTSRNVVVSFDSSGWQTVILQVMNSQGSSVISKTLIYVADNLNQITAPYFTGFEDTASVSQNWISINIDGDTPFFHPVSNAAHSGNSSILLNNFNSAVVWNEDDLISPPFDCTGLSDSACQISFWFSSATQIPETNILDSMEVSISTNCGLSWTGLQHIGGSTLDNQGAVHGFYIPSTGSTWTKLTIPFNPADRLSDVRFKISAFGTNTSNNLYIDDFDIGDAPTGITETTENALTVFPNPFNSEVAIRGLNAANYQVSVTDVTGRTVLNVPEISPDKTGSAIIDLSAIRSAGVYFIRISNSATTTTLKIMKP